LYQSQDQGNMHEEPVKMPMEPQSSVKHSLNTIAVNHCTSLQPLWASPLSLLCSICAC